MKRHYRSFSPWLFLETTRKQVDSSYVQLVSGRRFLSHGLCHSQKLLTATDLRHPPLYVPSFSLLERSLFLNTFISDLPRIHYYYRYYYNDDYNNVVNKPACGCNFYACFDYWSSRKITTGRKRFLNPTSSILYSSVFITCFCICS